MSRFLGCKRASAWAAVYGAVCADIRHQALSAGREMNEREWKQATRRARIAADQAQAAADAHEEQLAASGVVPRVD